MGALRSSVRRFWGPDQGFRSVFRTFWRRWERFRTQNGASMCASSAHRDPAYVRSRGVPSVQSLSVPTNIRPVPSKRPSAAQRARADVACGPCERTRTARSPARIARRSSGPLEMLLDRPRTARAVHLKRPQNLPIPLRNTFETPKRPSKRPRNACWNPQKSAMRSSRRQTTRVCALSGGCSPANQAAHQPHTGHMTAATDRSRQETLHAALSRPRDASSTRAFG